MRCPMCKKDMYVDKFVQVPVGVETKSKYSAGKGLLGAALLGPVGALAGVNGKQSSSVKMASATRYKCKNCGYMELKY